MKIIEASRIDPSFFEGRTFTNDVRQTVEDILYQVKTTGDAALHKFSTRFDRSNPARFEIQADILKDCESRLKKERPKLYDALCLSRDLALAFASKQRDSFIDFEIELTPGMITGQKTIAIERAGLYIPSGRFPLLSTVIMCACPAKTAPCKELLLCTPPSLHPDDLAFMGANPGTGADKISLKPWANEAILATASLCGLDRVFALGGAQAIAAMAYGTKSIPRCDIIVGPGNKYVAEAKRLLYGETGIDFAAGPTEVFIIADDSACSEWIAADLLAQAEHDPDAQAVLATPSVLLAEAVKAEVNKQLFALSTAETAGASIKNHGLIILTESLEQAAEIANRKAPEHLELALKAGSKRDNLEKMLHNYGSLFIGHKAAEVLGDYAAGLNHTLPTSTAARFTGGLSVRHFLKTLTSLRTTDNADSAQKLSAGDDLCPDKKSLESKKISESGLLQSLKASAVLADAEGLAAHAHAARLRLAGIET